jgi:hypothetical protein
MFIIVFRSRLSGDADEEYLAADKAMWERVRAITSDDPQDFLEYTSDDGERLAIIRWQNAKTLEKWRRDEAHLAAKQKGREKWYSFYEITVAEVVRTSTGGTTVDTSPLQLG